MAEDQNTVLIVNDTPEALELMEVVLRLAGYRVLTATDGRAGFAVAQREHPDMVVSDVMMPEVDGIELCRMIRADAQLERVPVLLVSGLLKGTPNVVEGLRAGADDYMEAPYDQLQLVAKVARMIERKQSEDALRESEARFRRIAESGITGIVFSELNGRITEANDAFLEIVGYAREDLLAGKLNWQELTPPEHSARDAQAIAELRASGRCAPFEKQCLRQDGRRVSVLLTAALLEGAPEQAVSIVLDITERKRAEEERAELLARERERTLRLRHLSEASLAINSAPSSAELLQLVAETARRIIGARQAVAVVHADTPAGQPLAAAAQTDEQAAWRASLENIDAAAFYPQLAQLTHPVRLTQAEWEGHAAAPAMSAPPAAGSATLADESEPAGASSAARLRMAAPLTKRGGETIGFIYLAYKQEGEFTEEDLALLAQLALMTSVAIENAGLLERVSAAKKVWEQTFDAIPDGVIVHDHRRRLVRCNVSAAESMDLSSPAAAIGLPYADAFARVFGPRAAAYHMEARDEAASSFELQAEDGRRYLVSIAPLDSLDEIGWKVVTWSDVTQLAAMQEQLSRSRRLAMVGQLAAGVAHEINNPLAVITACAEATLSDMRSAPETQALADEREWTYFMEETIRQALRCKGITRGLLELSRQRRARRAACDLNAVAAQCAQALEYRAQAAGVAVEVRISLDPQAGEIIATDEEMVQQILDNLLSNALAAIGERGQITVSTLREGERIVIEVADTGEGIPPNILPRIFDPFFTTKDPAKGSGLGLAICQANAEVLGGALTVASKQGAGSRFRLWIPRIAVEQVAEGEQVL